VIEIVEYIDAEGKNRFRRWVSGLDAGAKARVLAAVLRMEGGNFSVAKGIGSGVPSCGWISVADIESTLAGMENGS
jgi:hypothetical protein